MKIPIIALMATVVIQLTIIASTFASDCGNFPDRDFESKENSAFKGRYENGNYMYAVTIPKGLTGYSSPPPTPQHGFGIVLDWGSHAYIMFDSSANSLEYKSTKEAINDEVRWLRKAGADISGVNTKNTHLEKIPATRVEIHYTCAKSNQSRVRTMIISLRGQRALLDTASLDTTKDRLKSDMTVFEQMVSSWKVTGKY